MKNRIENLLNDVGGLMQRHLSKSEFESVTRLSTLLARLQFLQKRALELDAEISEIESTVKGLSGKNATERIAEIAPSVGHSNGDSLSPGRAGAQTLRIEIDWKANGKDHEREIIFVPKAADCMTRFLKRVIDEFGEDALQKLRRIQVNRGPLLSETPQTDFLNQAQGELYAHQPLPGTKCHVLTHSQTSQKVKDINRVCRVIGFVSGSVMVEAVGRSNYYSEKYA